MKQVYLIKSIMENGHNAAASSSTRHHKRMPSFVDLLPDFKGADSISTQCSEIMDHFSLEVAQLIASKTVVKEIEELSHQICKYHSLALTIGTNIDGSSLRQELLERQQKACDKVISTTSQLSNAFRRVDIIPKKEISDLERACRILVACIHTLDRELRRTMNLYHLFPLVPDLECTKESHLVKTGYFEKNDFKVPPLLSFHASPSEKYLKERESWKELEKEILRVHDLDVELHRDSVLGPILDYLTLCPMGEIPGSTVSLDDTSDLPAGYCDEETLFQKKSNLICYISAIIAVACIGGGVLMGVIFMMVQ
ncbi:uncharacterized protein [Parasteatoda tepidariorum]|uniref:uncharacterized protein isoform X1 n=2 Tax=Parasteatoda tepidariorum TaxID=114398 RepID=UPI001C71CFC1|nr:uncharacterized protein LOC107445328 isoform X2 [Parasteatoda tepidariorum]